MSHQEAVELADIVEEGLTARFSTKPLLPCQLIRDREFQLSDGNRFPLVRAEPAPLSSDFFFCLFL